jgi:hypothetical protein
MLYHVLRNGQNYGPYTLEDLQKYVASGNVLPTDLAKSDETADWVPVSQILGIATPPSSLTPAVAYGAAVPAYPVAGVRYPDPPNLHWALVLLIGFFTCGIFFYIWMLVQAAWMRKVNPNSKALLYYIAAIVIYIIYIFARVELLLAARNGGSTATFTAVSALAGIAYLVLFLVAIFTMRSDLEEHFNGPEPIGLSLSGVMTFFFNVFYFQHHLTRINELKRQARYGGAAI